MSPRACSGTFGTVNEMPWCRLLTAVSLSIFRSYRAATTLPNNGLKIPWPALMLRLVLLVGHPGLSSTASTKSAAGCFLCSREQFYMCNAFRSISWPICKLLPWPQRWSRKFDLETSLCRIGIAPFKSCENFVLASLSEILYNQPHPPKHFLFSRLYL